MPDSPSAALLIESVKRAELLAQAAHQVGDIVDLAEIERHERQSALPGLSACAIAAATSLVSRARQRDRVIAGGGKSLRDGKAEPAAAAGHHHAARVLGRVVRWVLGCRSWTQSWSCSQP